MKLYLCIIGLFLSAAPAQAQIVHQTPPLADDQSLPLGLTLVLGTQRTATKNPNQKTETPLEFAVLTPPPSAYDNWWTDLYVAQLEDLGWKSMGGAPPITPLVRETGKCREDIMLITMGPQTKDITHAETKESVAFEFNFIGFKYRKSEACKASVGKN